MSVEAAMIVTLFVTSPTPELRAAVADAAASAAADRHALHVLSEEERFVLGGDVDEQIRRCGSDMVCVAERVRPVRAALVALTLVNGAVDPPLVDVRFIDVANRTVIFGSARAAPADEIPATVEALLSAGFDRARHPKTGHLEIVPTPSDAVVTVTPELENRDAVAPGTYVVRIERPGYVPAEEAVDVAPGEHVRLARTLEPEPTVLGRWWLWAGIAAVVAGSAIATAVALDDSKSCFCVGGPDAMCPSSCP